MRIRLKVELDVDVVASTREEAIPHRKCVADVLDRR